MTTESKHFSWSTKAPLGFYYLFTPPPPPCCSTANTIETETRCVVISSRDAQSGNHVTAQKDKELGDVKKEEKKTVWKGANQLSVADSNGW